ncbi:MAG: HDOD domain-containing protein [Halieaceae bacterium]|jgi:two-component system, cell cycle response regulator|nr:HDOD domain-containing protein [Halieaceae bacterium]
MKKDALLAAVLSSDDLPSLPTVAAKLISMMSDEDASLNDIADVVSMDVALSAKILKVANSAYYSFPQKVDSMTRAVSMLGLNAVRSLALSFSFLTIKGNGKSEQIDFETFWHRSVAAAVCSDLILKQLPGTANDSVFISGLLHNIGQLVLARTFPEDYEIVLASVEDNVDELQSAELTLFGVDHCFIGYEVAKHWGFPPSLLLPIRYHHSPKECTDDDLNAKLATQVIYLADLLLNILYSSRPDIYHEQFNREAREILDIDQTQIESILEEAPTLIDEAGANFGLNAPETRPIQEILQAANARLTQLNLDYDQMNKELVKAHRALERLTEELQRKNALLDDLANIDGLTEIYNHRYFQTALDKEVSRVTRKKVPLSLILIDIDHFKRFNDNHGHQVGDLVLREFSRVLGANLRGYDTLARYGGEEFVVILAETAGQEAFRVAEKLRVAVESYVFEDDQDKYRVTASFGITCFTPADSMSLDKTQLIKEADNALYDAKAQGRNQVVIHGVSKASWRG